MSEPTDGNPDDERRKSLEKNGKDEMNLAEFPFAALRRRGDSRIAITYENWVTDKDGSRYQQKWIARGLAGIGLPTEFDERVYVALMYITAQRGFENRKVPFSVYQILKIMGESTDKTHYEVVEKSLDRLKGVTIKAEGAFWDNERKELVRTMMAFNLIDEYWLRYREKDDKVKVEQGVPAYIVWGERIWKSIKSGYVKSLDKDFYFSLESPIARRLYRLLDKRLRDKNQYEFDIFDLAGKLGMARYRYPAEIRKKLQPAFDELIATGFLLSAKVVKVGGYTRIRFVRAPRYLSAPQEGSVRAEPPASSGEAPEPSGPEPQLPIEAPHEVLHPVGSPIVQRLLDLHITLDKARELAATYSPDTIEEKLDLLAWNQQTRKRGRPITNPAAWLIRA